MNWALINFQCRFGVSWAIALVFIILPMFLTGVCCSSSVDYSSNPNWNFSQRSKKYKQQNILLHCCLRSSWSTSLFFPLRKWMKSLQLQGKITSAKLPFAQKRSQGWWGVFFIIFSIINKCISQPPRRKQSALICTYFCLWWS